MIRKAVTEALQNKNSVMLITTIFFIIGVLSFFYNNALLWSALVTLIGLILLIKNYVSIKYIIFWILMFYLGFFISSAKMHSSDILVTLAPSDAKITGRIITIPNSSTRLDKTKFFLDVQKFNNKSVKAKTLVTVTDKNEDFKDLIIGDTYEFKGKLILPFSSGNPSQFDYSRYLRNFNVFTVYYTDKANIKKVDTVLTPKWKFLQNLNKLRNKILATHAEYIKSPNLEILGGIVFGDDAVAPPYHIRKFFLNSGLLHTLAASGMNVAFIYGFWFFFMRKLRVPFKLSVISGMIVIILYTFMTGLGPSLIRATLMLLIILIGKLIDRDTHSVSLLALVALLMLIYNPAYINDIGFQLSFTVTFGLLTTGAVIFEKLKKTKIPEWLSATILVPAIAQIWVAPLQMFYFGTFTNYSILSNILCMPFLSIVSFSGFISSIIAIFTPFTKFICMPLDYLLNYMLSIIVWLSKTFASLDKAMLRTTHPNALQIFIFYAIIIIITIAIKYFSDKKLLKRLSYIICALALILVASTINIPNHKLEIIAFNVQNADCFLIKTPENKFFIIDTGRPGFNGSNSQAENTIIKYMLDKGFKNIQGMIVTHFDNDHSGGAYDIMQELNVKNVYLNSFSDKSKSAGYIYNGLKEFNINAEIPKNNTTIYTEKDLSIKTYYANLAPKKFKYESQHENENSIITLLQYKDFDMLFMGDAGIKAFNTVEKDIPQNIEVLKVGHHGGPHVVDKNMLEKMKTEVSIVSTGKNNFGHPNRGTIDALRETEIYRTDTHNSIKISTNGNKYDVLSFDKNKNRYIKSQQYETIH